MSELEDQTPKASGSRKLYKPSSFPTITPKAIVQQPQSDIAYSESKLAQDSLMENISSHEI